jgi:hypothetical protein
MHWNYRLVKDRHGFISIHEAYYHKNGRMYAITTEPISIGGDNISEIRRVLRQIRKDVERSKDDVIDEDEWNKKCGLKRRQHS